MRRGLRRKPSLFPANEAVLANRKQRPSIRLCASQTLRSLSREYQRIYHSDIQTEPVLQVHPLAP